jgi:hypothetical protein
MDVRRNKTLVTALTALTTLTLASVAGMASCGGNGLRPGDASPAIWRGADLRTPVVAWVFRGEDCLSCFTPARELRGLQAEYGDRIGIWAVAVDDTRGLAGPFLRAERIRARHQSIDSDTHRRVFGRSELPTLYLSLRDTVRAVWTPQRPDASSPDYDLSAMVRLIADLPGRRIAPE